MYCDTRFSITSQPASTTSTVMKAVSGTNHSEMPSMPREYWMLKRLDPHRLLDELHAVRGIVELGDERQGHQQADDGTDQRKTARKRRIAVAADRQDEDTEGDRTPDRQAQEG